MEPNKFEDNIKDKLEKRTLQPSNDAWDKLSERLDNQGKNKNIKPVLWLGVAASIVGILLVISQFFNHRTRINNAPETVVVPEILEQKKNNAIVIEKHINIEHLQVDEEEAIVEPIKKVVPVEITKKQTIIVQENNLKKLKKESVNPVEVKLESLTFEQEKIQVVANKIKALKDNNEVTDDAIDALLFEAQKEIRLNQLYNKTTGVVDANLLLQDVEADLDQSFRSKVFETIKLSYGTVKSAIAQRND
ncbi:hypothetical protein [Flavivirga jejuensis]|uniref:Uncharacterized protein n=1 Tax=Flavivirga jejuensis TaxID=870487 RepID=A0ABT8WJ30_9FLAO|nr:hypothetical protein [Flavivirga jejuensis]MDO5973088.1 hypothetical protein [Flavivirga jejuensis]